MKLEVERYRLKIVPESEIDKAYIEEVLGLRQDGDSIPCRRVNAMGLNAIAYLEISRSPAD